MIQKEIKRQSDEAMYRQYESCQRCPQFKVGCKDFQQCPVWCMHQGEINRLEELKRR